MKFFLILNILLFISLNAKELFPVPIDTPWRVERTNFYFENDLFLGTDSQYTSGWKLSNLYFLPHVNSELLKIPFLHDVSRAHFFSMGISQQIYTPQNTEALELIEDDRPYAGWLYLELGIHQSSPTQLDSLVLRVGIVGEASGASITQSVIHELRDIDIPNGWDNQLNDELGITLTYQHKWRLIPKPILGMQSNFIPFVEGSLGNIKTEATAGVLMRFGLNPIEDFGSSSIDVGGENGIPIRTDCLCPEYKPWSFTLNFTMAGSAIARDIFLDGNTFSQSHSVDKESFVGYVSYGFSLRYEHFAVDYVLTDHSKQFKTEEDKHGYGSILLSWLY